MQTRPRGKATQALLQRRRRRIWGRVVTVLAAIVVFCTTYALILPAITQERDAGTVCGLQEHVHTDACYDLLAATSSTTVLCPVTDALHTHDALCYAPDGSLRCTLPERWAHVHTEACYDTSAGNALHVHNVFCYAKARGQLLCILPHVHTDACYTQVQGALICQLGTVGPNSPLICTIVDPAVHQHSESCFATTTTEAQKILRCTIPLHVHTSECRPTQNVGMAESPELWEASLPALTGDAASDLIAVAQSQLGYAESFHNYIIQADKTVSGYTRYGDWWGDPYGDWSAMFAAFCVRYAGLSGVPLAGNAADWAGLLAEAGLYRPMDGTSGVAVPNPGNLLFLDKSGDGIPDGVAIIAAYGDYTITAIEGDVRGSVAYASYTIFDPAVKAFAVPSAGLPLDSCGKPIHAHGDGCYNAAGAVVCGLEAHEAGVACFTVSSPAMMGQLKASYTVGEIGVDVNGNYVKQYDLNILPSVSTRDLIEINLYDYGTGAGKQSINAEYNNASSTKQPYIIGFQWPGGGDRGLGDYIVSDQDGVNGVGITTATNKSINSLGQDGPIPTGAGASKYANAPQWYRNTTSTKWTTAKYFNAPHAIQWKAISGTQGTAADETKKYPQYSANGTLISMEKYFSESTVAKKMNTQSVDGLFLYNEQTGAYHFNSRTEFAEFHHEDVTVNGKNYGSDVFLVYDEILTPDFILYPFGNFLPFQRIATQTTAVKSITFDYMKAQKTAATNLSKTNTAYSAKYSALATSLGKYYKGNGNYSRYTTEAPYMDMMLSYLMTSVSPDGPTKDTLKAQLEAEPLADGLYNVDFTEQTNFFFGMEVRMQFFQPKGGLTGEDHHDNDSITEEDREQGNLTLSGNGVPDGLPDAHMYFDFTGDDDVMIYIDDILFLDLSGIHRHIGGRIDFYRGVVRYYSLGLDNGLADEPYLEIPFVDILRAAGKTDAEIDALLVERDVTYMTDGVGLVTETIKTFRDYSEHTFDMFYMERGSGSGICRLNFNFPLLRENAIAVEKVLTIDESQTQLTTPEIAHAENMLFAFQILDANPVGTDPVTGQPIYQSFFRKPIQNEDDDNGIARTSYHPYYYIYRNKQKLMNPNPEIDPDTGQPYTDGRWLLDDSGIFHLKAGDLAEFPNIQANAGDFFIRELVTENEKPQYGTITYNGGAGEVSNQDGIMINGVRYYGYDSPKQHTDDSRIYHFSFDNVLTPERLGSLTIAKKLPGTIVSDETFKMKVLLDGEPLKIGETYRLYADEAALAADEYTEKKVSLEAGIVELKAGQYVKIPYINLGTTYTVEEVDIPKQMMPSYENATGTILYDVNATVQTSQHVMVTVTNNSAMKLPETGGVGTLPYTLCGISLVSLAAWLAFRRWRVCR